MPQKRLPKQALLAKANAKDQLDDLAPGLDPFTLLLIFKFIDFKKTKFKFIDFEKTKFKFIEFEKTKFKFIDFEKT